MKLRTFYTVWVGTFLILQSLSFESSAAFLSEVNLHGELFDPTTQSLGGLGVATAELSDSGNDVLPSGATRSISAWTIASAETGRLAFNMSSTISVAADDESSRKMAFVQSTNNRIQDDFNIGAGGGLSDGDIAQVLLQVRLDGTFQQQGIPSGSSQFSLILNARGSDPLPTQVDFDTGGLNPPQFFVVDEEWDLLVNVEVGGTLGIDALMSGWINGSSCAPGDTCTNILDFDPIFRVSNAPGFDLLITSDSGASTSPIPIPAAFYLFGSGLLGLVGVARRKKT